MALVRWDPARDLDLLQTDVNRLFNSFFGSGAGSPGNGQTRRWVPPMDLVETDEHLVLRADLPGMSEEDVAIEARDGDLVISGERKSEHEEKGEGFYRIERAFGTFQRTLALPDGVDLDKVNASFDNGVLEVRIPKPEERKPRQIAIGGRTLEGTGEQK
jgi:HSP20 family protein